MGTSAAENIALEVSSEADTQAIKSARDDVTALGTAAKQASDDMVAGFDDATASTEKFTDTVQEHGEVAQRSQGNVRSLAVEVSHLSLAFETGEGSALGMVRAASLAATEIAELSGVVEIAAGASVIGALVAIVGTIITLFEKASDSTDKFSNSLSRLSTETAQQLAIEEDSANKQLAFVNDQIKANDALVASSEQMITSGNPLLAATGAAALKAAEATGKDLVAQQQALSATLTGIYAAQGKIQQDTDDQVAEHKRQLEAEAEREAIADAARAQTLLAQMTEDQQEAIDQITLSEEDAAIQKLVREEKAREQEISDLKISEEEKTELILAAQADRDARIKAIHKKSTDAQQAADDAAAAAQAAADNAALNARVNAEKAVLEQSLAAGDSFAKTMTKLLLTPLEKELEGIAASQLVQAYASAASFDFAGAALHLAAAAAAVEGARLVSQIGGLSSGAAGVGGVPSGSNAASGNTLAPSNQNQSGNVTVNLLTTDPYSRENIMIASYELQRAGILNRPIYVPPTTGMRSAA